MVQAERAVLEFVGRRNHRSELQQMLLWAAGGESRFLQYSATFYLTTHRLLDPEHIDQLVSLVEKGITTDPRARQTIVLAAFGQRNAKYRRFFERRILDAREVARVRVSALRALHGLKPAYLRALAPAVDKTGDPALKRTLQALNAEAGRK
jgi:hypothetical protein